MLDAAFFATLCQVHQPLEVMVLKHNVLRPHQVFILQVPIAVDVFGVSIVVDAVLDEHAQGLAIVLLDEIRIDVAAANVGETADQTDDVAKFGRPLPGEVGGPLVSSVTLRIPSHDQGDPTG